VLRGWAEIVMDYHHPHRPPPERRDVHLTGGAGRLVLHDPGRRRNRDGVKQHELHFEAEDIALSRNGWRVR
jgi:hypothetical protein